MINLYAAARPLTDVVGRVSYATDPRSQGEHLLLVEGNQDPEFWHHLAHTCQATFKPRKVLRDIIQADGSIKKELVDDQCCEAHEIIVALPNKFAAFSADHQKDLLQNLSGFIKMMTGTDNVIALHDSHKGEKIEANVHVHIIFPERVMLREPIEVRAERDLFYNENGKRVYRKAEILDEQGKVRQECRIVPKGTLRYTKYFGPQIRELRMRYWLDGAKHGLCDWINEHLQPDELRQVYDPIGPYLAQLHVGKLRYGEAGCLVGEQDMIIRWNENVKCFNRYVRSGLLTEREALDYKTQLSLAPGFIAQCDELEVILSDIELRKTARCEFSNEELAWREAEITQLEIAERCATGSTEDKKRLLRDLYRQSQLTWQTYRDEKDFTKKALLSKQAREISASIERVRTELGYDTYPTVYQRKQAVMEVAEQVWELSTERQNAKAAAQSDRAAAYENLRIQRSKLTELKKQKTKNVRSSWQRNKVAATKTYNDNVEFAKERLADAEKNYKAAQKTYKLYTGAERLLAEYRAYALQVAADEALSDYEAERARNKYLAAARRLQHLDEETLREMRKQLEDLKRSQVIRKAKAQAAGKEDSVASIQCDIEETQKTVAEKER